ncbi:MAG: prepilin-type N-terminal cleavage/methylation domain-containing protein, partial [Cephaloticoccus sp.]|nr:prepilin-type N-terminal cleavage/methylation domain-containing protein [Cephaloticoccus sp.]
MSIFITNHSRSRAPSRGFTLVELLVVVVLSGIVLTGVMTTNLQLMRSGVRITQYAEMSTQIRRGFEQLGTDLRNAQSITWNGPSDITMTVPTLSGTSRAVTYAWTNATQSFFVVPGTDSTVTTGRIILVRGIPAYADGSPGASFSRYDRTGGVATTDLAMKRIQLTLNVVRQARTSATATDTAVSAAF